MARLDRALAACGGAMKYRRFRNKRASASRRRQRTLPSKGVHPTPPVSAAPPTQNHRDLGGRSRQRQLQRIGRRRSRSPNLFHHRLPANDFAGAPSSNKRKADLATPRSAELRTRHKGGRRTDNVGSDLLASLGRNAVHDRVQAMQPHSQAAAMEPVGCPKRNYGS